MENNKKEKIELNKIEREFLETHILKVFTKSKDNAPKIINFLTVDKSSGNINTIKSTNILINLRQAVQNLPSFILESASAVSLPNLLPKYKIPTFVLFIIMKLKQLATIKLDELTSIILVSLWDCKEPNRNWINTSDGYNKALSNLKEVGIEKLTEKRFNLILDDLEKIGCIAKLSKSSIYLEEKFLFRV